MLQDTELWSVLEVRRYTGTATLSDGPATWQKTLMPYSLGFLVVFIDSVTSSMPGSRPMLPVWIPGSTQKYTKEVSTQIHPVSLALCRLFIVFPLYFYRILKLCTTSMSSSCCNSGLGLACFGIYEEMVCGKRTSGHPDRRTLGGHSRGLGRRGSPSSFIYSFPVCRMENCLHDLRHTQTALVSWPSTQARALPSLTWNPHTLSPRTSCRTRLGWTWSIQSVSSLCHVRRPPQAQIADDVLHLNPTTLQAMIYLYAAG